MCLQGHKLVDFGAPTYLGSHSLTPLKSPSIVMPVLMGMEGSVMAL